MNADDLLNIVNRVADRAHDVRRYSRGFSELASLRALHGLSFVLPRALLKMIEASHLQPGLRNGIYPRSSNLRGNLTTQVTGRMEEFHVP